jgi:hypothetical protein
MEIDNNSIYRNPSSAKHPFARVNHTRLSRRYAKRRLSKRNNAAPFILHLECRRKWRLSGTQFDADFDPLFRHRAPDPVNLSQTHLFLRQGFFRANDDLLLFRIRRST